MPGSAKEVTGLVRAAEVTGGAAGGGAAKVEVTTLKSITPDGSPSVKSDPKTGKLTDENGKELTPDQEAAFNQKAAAEARTAKNFFKNLKNGDFGWRTWAVLGGAVGIVGVISGIAAAAIKADLINKKEFDIKSISKTPNNNKITVIYSPYAIISTEDQVQFKTTNCITTLTPSPADSAKYKIDKYLGINGLLVNPSKIINSTSFEVYLPTGYNIDKECDDGKLTIRTSFDNQFKSAASTTGQEILYAANEVKNQAKDLAKDTTKTLAEILGGGAGNLTKSFTDNLFGPIDTNIIYMCVGITILILLFVLLKK